MSISLTAALIIASVVAPAAAQPCAQVDKIALQLPRPVQVEYAGFVVPTSQTAGAGAPKFADECLEVKVQGGGTGYDPLQELKSGKADLAIAEGSYVAQKIASGEKLTIVAGYYQKNGLVWMGLNKANFASVQDLANKKVGTWCCGYGSAFPAIISKLGSSLPTTIVSQNPYSLEQLFSGEVDLASAMVYDELARPLQTLDGTSNFLKQQADLYVLDPANYNLTLVHNVLVVETATLTAVGMRAKLVRFLKVVTKSWHFCRNNEVACASAFSEYGVPTAHQLWQMREVNRFIFPALSGHGLGILSLDRWNSMNQWLVSSSFLSSAISSTVVDNSLALDAGALDDVSQWAPSGQSGVHFCGEYGSQANLRICQGNEHTLCLAGQEPVGPTDGTCKQCEPGRFAPKNQRMNVCLVCPSGRYSKTAGQSECDTCQPGRFWASDANTKTNAVTDCTSCPVGFFSSGTGASECRACNVGSIASSKGTSDCERCPFGHYADATGQSECKECEEGMATLYLGSASKGLCVCPEGTYRTQASTTCQACPEGMSCAVDSWEYTLLLLAKDPTMDATVVGEFPRVRKGYYAKRSEPLKTYLCKEDSTCPGDLPEKCNSQLTGLACGQCKAGYYKDGHQCLECNEIDESAFNYPLIQIIVGPFIVFGLYCAMQNSHEDWGSWWNEMCNVTFTFLVQYQILGLLVYTFLQYPESLSSLLMPWTYLVDLPSMLRLGCSKYADFRNLIIVKETAPGLLLAIFVLTYCVGFAIGKMLQMGREQAQPPAEDAGGAPPQGSEGVQWFINLFPFKADILVNCYFAIFHTFYLSICFISLQLFMCYEHPTGDWSLIFEPKVFCYASEEWGGMVTESIFAILIYIAAPISGFAFVIHLAPSHFHKLHYHERWKFLFIKFKPDSYWWGIFHMLRSLLMCLTLVFSQTGSRQVYYIFIMLLFYAALLVIWFPWRHRSSNLFDLLVTCLLLFFCSLSSSFSRRNAWLDVELADFAATVTFSPIVVLVVLLSYAAWLRLNPRSVKLKKAKQVELATDCRSVFTKFVALVKDKEAQGTNGETSAEAFVERLSAQNRDILRGGCAVIVGELLGHQPGNVALPWRLVSQEQKSGARTWAPTIATPQPAGSV